MSTIAYTELATEMGDFLVAATAEGLVQVNLPGDDRREALMRLAAIGEPVEDAGALAAHLEVLRAYFAGTRGDLDLPLDWSLVRGGFRREALRALARVEHGEVVSYAELAERAGRPRAVRAAGTACATNPLPLVVPCHRVVRSDGTLGNYGGGVPLKARLLEHEGVCVGGDPPRVMVPLLG